MPLLQNLKRVRQERRMTLQQLSAKSGISADSISDFEEMGQMASARTARKRAEAVGVREEGLK